MKFKVGERVKLKNLDFFKKILDYQNNNEVEKIPKPNPWVIDEMFNYAGKYIKIEEVTKYYYAEEIFWAEWMFEEKQTKLIDIE